MTEQLVAQAEPVNPEAERKRVLIAEGAARNPPVKLDTRYSVKRMEEALGYGAAPAPAAAPSSASKERDDEVARLKREMERELEELRAERAKLAAANAAADKAAAELAQAPPAMDPKYKVPTGTMTTQPTSITSDVERAALMEQAIRLGIQNAIPKNAGNDWIGQHISRHLAAKAQEQQILDEMARQQALMPAIEVVDALVLYKGDGKISRGVHIPGQGDVTYKRGDIIKAMPKTIALEQRENGYVEIIDAA